MNAINFFLYLSNVLANFKVCHSHSLLLIYLHSLSIISTEFFVVISYYFSLIFIYDNKYYNDYGRY